MVLGVASMLVGMSNWIFSGYLVVAAVLMILSCTRLQAVQNCRSVLQLSTVVKSVLCKFTRFPQKSISDHKFPIQIPQKSSIISKQCHLLQSCADHASLVLSESVKLIIVLGFGQKLSAGQSVGVCVMAVWCFVPRLQKKLSHPQRSQLDLLLEQKVAFQEERPRLVELHTSAWCVIDDNLHSPILVYELCSNCINHNHSLCIRLNMMNNLVLLCCLSLQHCHYPTNPCQPR